MPLSIIAYTINREHKYVYARERTEHHLNCSFGRRFVNEYYCKIIIIIAYTPQKTIKFITFFSFSFLVSFDNCNNCYMWIVKWRRRTTITMMRRRVAAVVVDALAQCRPQSYTTKLLLLLSMQPKMNDWGLQRRGIRPHRHKSYARVCASKVDSHSNTRRTPIIMNRKRKINTEVM